MKRINFSCIKTKQFINCIADRMEEDNINLDREEIRLEHFLYFILFQLQKLWYYCKSRCEQNLQDIGAYDALDKLARLSAKNPVLALLFSIGTLILALPLLILLVFALSTFLLTFTGFIVIEGTLITVASALLFACLGAVAVIFFFFGAIAFAGYYIIYLFNGLQNRRAFNQYMNTERNQTRRTDD